MQILLILIDQNEPELKKLNDTYFRLAGIPLIALMGHIIFFNRNDGGEERFGFWEIYCLSLLETLVLWEVERLVIRYYRNRFPSLHQTRQRIGWMLLVGTAVALAIRVINIWIYDKTLLWGYAFPLEGYLHAVFVALLFVIIIGGIYEGIFYLRMWHKTSVEAEALKKEHLQTQLDTLKAQINPHFLFNSLSSLASLILEEPHKAVDFVDELSSVYRYVLQANEKTITTLKSELEFIDSYFRLLQIRFGNGIALEKKIPEGALAAGIAPLTLQLLLENAIKHNAVLPDSPLVISIEVQEPQRLLVRNNLQRRSSPPYSGKLGLQNIKRKYELLNQPPVMIEETAGYFSVCLPLIKSPSL